MGVELEAWSDFNVAIVGAAAALAGLVIVAASVNIREIVGALTVTSRLASAIVALVVALSMAAIGLVPAITGTVYGALAVAGAVVAGAFQVHAASTILRGSAPSNGDTRSPWVKAAIGFLPVVAYLVSGIALLAGHPSGLYLAAAAALLTIASALLVSWIALVEVLR
jgi:hypothetical protein